MLARKTVAIFIFIALNTKPVSGFYKVVIFITKLHNEELNDLYSLPNIVRVVKSRRMRWAGHVA